MGEGPGSVEDVAKTAEAYLHETSLTPEEYESLKLSIAELQPIFSAGQTYFVLGSYGRLEIHRLQCVKGELNGRPNAFAFLMIDVSGEWTNTYLKFRILAAYADFIVGIAEHAHGGFLVEQGYFTALEQYFTKTHVLKRDYESANVVDLDTRVETETPYSEMQTSIFDMLDEHERLYLWTTKAELLECVARIP